jgi:apolipoprotein D and lipocalin family protein
MRYAGLILPLLILTGSCSNLQFSDFSRSMDVVDDVRLERYLGSWYEYARLDVSFERGMTETKAKYTLLDPDKEGRTRIRVVNSGIKNGKRKEAKAKAVIPDPDEAARIQVSFFGPFYSDYNIIALDRENYQWAMVAGSSPKYLWILTRKPELEPAVLNELKKMADGYGFNTAELIFPQKK